MQTRARDLTFLALVSAALLTASGCSSSGSSTPGSPNADAAGLFPHSFDQTRLLRASAATSARRDYTLRPTWSWTALGARFRSTSVPVLTARLATAIRPVWPRTAAGSLQVSRSRFPTPKMVDGAPRSTRRLPATIAELSTRERAPTSPRRWAHAKCRYSLLCGTAPSVEQRH
jgi:hypothetical protein